MTSARPCSSIQRPGTSTCRARRSPIRTCWRGSTPTAGFWTASRLSCFRRAWRQSSWRQPMADTSAAGGASRLAGIPGLTRIYAPGEQEPSFAELLAACTSSAVHLEIHDVHRTSDMAYQAWLAGQADVQESAEQYRAYAEVVRSAVRRNVIVRRARIVSEPVSDYVRWEHWLTGPVNIEAGEQVRWLPRRLASTLA